MREKLELSVINNNSNIANFIIFLITPKATKEMQYKSREKIKGSVVF